MGKAPHPTGHTLDDEEVSVRIELRHRATGTVVEAAALSREGETVTKAIDRAQEEAMDLMLGELEVIGV